MPPPLTLPLQFRMLSRFARCLLLKQNDTIFRIITLALCYTSNECSFWCKIIKAQYLRHVAQRFSGSVATSLWQSTKFCGVVCLTALKCDGCEIISRDCTSIFLPRLALIHHLLRAVCTLPMYFVLMHFLALPSFHATQRAHNATICPQNSTKTLPFFRHLGLVLPRVAKGDNRQF